MKSHVKALVVGGGAVGTSIAYHLARAGWDDVVLLERDELTSGSTWHAAGLLPLFNMSFATTHIHQYSVEFYKQLEAETGLNAGFSIVGNLRMAQTKERMDEYMVYATTAETCGVPYEWLSSAQIKERYPLVRSEDLVGAIYHPTDGYINPADVTMAMAKGARMKGVKIIQGTPVTGVLTRNGTVTGVRTDKGEIRSEFVVNCAGMWARQLGEQSGVVIPNQAAEHYYLITDDIDGMSPDMPVLEDPSTHAYYREETGGLMVGMFEPECAPWKVDGIPDDFSLGELPPDWDRLTPYLEKAMARVPVSMEVGIRKFFCGPESFTPDLAPVIGEAPELRNYFVAAGLNSVGIITGGGIGRVVAHWMLTGRPDVDVTAINIDRFHPYQCNPEYRRQRALESLGLVYACHYPDRSPVTARGARQSPFHDRLAANRAHFRDVSGWECPGWYAPEGHEPVADRLTWGRPNWFEWWAAEHKACREDVIAMDMSFMGKFMVQGRDAGTFLNYISANEVNAESGKITYTQWLNEGGTLEADLTVIKLNEETFMVVTSDIAHRHTETWMKRHIRNDQHVFITDVTSGYGQLNIQGPKSRELLQSLTSADLSNEAFPFRTAREIDIGLARVMCVRITYAGELGYELNIPSEQALHVYDRIVAAGEPFGLRHAGLRSLASLRLEKGYRDYGHDIDNMDDPYSVGLGFAIRLDKEGDFIGKQACIERKANRHFSHRLIQILLKDPEPQMIHAEIVLRNGEPVGDVRAAAYGHTLGGSVGLAMVEGDPVDLAYLEEGTWEVDIAGNIYPAEVSLKPMYDPGMTRIKA